MTYQEFLNVQELISTDTVVNVETASYIALGLGEEAIIATIDMLKERSDKVVADLKNYKVLADSAFSTENLEKAIKFTELHSYFTEVLRAIIKMIKMLGIKKDICK